MIHVKLASLLCLNAVNVNLDVLNTMECAVSLHVNYKNSAGANKILGAKL